MSITFSPVQKELQKLLQLHIENDPFLKKSIVSIYGIGSLAKNKPKIGDLDLNIFSRDISFQALLAIETMFEVISKTMNMPVDVNVVDMQLFDYNIAGSDLFTHKNRHSLFLYELKTVHCLIYGPDILDSVTIKQSDLLTESVKLVATLVHRLNKDYLTGGPTAAMKQAKKFSKYACEFALIAKGIANPYLVTDETLFLKHFPLFESNLIVKKIWEDKAWDAELLALSYDFILALSHFLSERYRLLITKHHPHNTVIIGDASHYPEAWFVFNDQDDLNDFFRAYDAQSNHRKIY